MSYDLVIIDYENSCLRIHFWLLVLAACLQLRKRHASAARATLDDVGTSPIRPENGARFIGKAAHSGKRGDSYGAVLKPAPARSIRSRKRWAKYIFYIHADRGWTSITF